MKYCECMHSDRARPDVEGSLCIVTLISDLTGRLQHSDSVIHLSHQQLSSMQWGGGGFLKILRLKTNRSSTTKTIGQRHFFHWLLSCNRKHLAFYSETFHIATSHSATRLMLIHIKIFIHGVPRNDLFVRPCSANALIACCCYKADQRAPMDVNVLV